MQVPSYGGNRNRENWVRPVFSFDHQSGSITFFLVHFFLAHLDQIAFSPIDNDIGDDRYYRYRGRSLIRFPLLSRIIQRSEPTQVVAFHGGGKVTAGSTCSVLLRRNYFPNSICSKFGAGADILRKFSKRNTLSNDCTEQSMPYIVLAYFQSVRRS